MIRRRDPDHEAALAIAVGILAVAVVLLIVLAYLATRR